MFTLDLNAVTRKLMDEYRPEFEQCANGTDQSGWKPAIVMIHQDGQRTVARIGINQEDKYAKMQAVAATARLMQPMAVAMLMDVTGANVEKLPITFPQPESGQTPTPQQLQDYNHRVYTWLKANYQGCIANLPASMRMDAYMCVLKGPGFPDQGLMQRYHIQNGKVIWDEISPAPATSVMFDMLPNWWEKLNPATEALIREIRG